VGKRRIGANDVFIGDAARLRKIGFPLHWSILYPLRVSVTLNIDMSDKATVQRPVIGQRSLSPLLLYNWESNDQGSQFRREI